MNIFSKLFKKRRPKPITEFSKWVVKMVLLGCAWVAVFGALVIVAQIYIVATREYSNITIDLPAYIDYAKEALLVLLGYVCAAAFVNRAKINKGYDPHYDDKFKPDNNNGGEDET